MKERPILFSAPMVRAILAGRKTVTRRIVRDAKPIAADVTVFGTWVANDAAVLEEGARMLRCPYGVPGDRLWVKEALVPTAGNGVTYAVDGEYVLIDGGAREWMWKPRKLAAMYCPRWASRITLEVVDVRVERLHDLDEEDADAEGIGEPPWGSRVETFATLWDTINGKRAPWASNPWVWRVEFRSTTGEGGE